MLKYYKNTYLWIIKLQLDDFPNSSSWRESPPPIIEKECKLKFEQEKKQEQKVTRSKLDQLIYDTKISKWMIESEEDKKPILKEILINDCIDYKKIPEQFTVWIVIDLEVLYKKYIDNPIQENKEKFDKKYEEFKRQYTIRSYWTKQKK